MARASAVRTVVRKVSTATLKRAPSLESTLGDVTPRPVSISVTASRITPMAAAPMIYLSAVSAKKALTMSPAGISAHPARAGRNKPK